MKLPNNFNYYIEKKIARKITPDKSRAEFLIRESENSIEGLKERVKIIGINDKNSNSIIKDCYDIIMEKIRAKMFLDGFVASGNFAHESEVAYLQNLNFPEKEIAFLNDLRYFRNGITYYGKILDSEYAAKVYEFLKRFLEIFNKEVKDGKG